MLLAFGKTMYEAQHFEASLKTALRLTEAFACQPGEHPITDEDFAAIDAGTDRRTMGNAVRRMLDRLTVMGVRQFNTVAVDSLADAVVVRNLLAHDYLPARARLLHLPLGSEIVLAELESYRETFVAATAITDHIEEVFVRVMMAKSSELLASTWDRVVSGYEDPRPRELDSIRAILAARGVAVPKAEAAS